MCPVKRNICAAHLIEQLWISGKLGGKPWRRQPHTICPRPTRPLEHRLDLFMDPPPPGDQDLQVEGCLTGCACLMKCSEGRPGIIEGSPNHRSVNRFGDPPDLDSRAAKPGVDEGERPRTIDATPTIQERGAIEAVGEPDQLNQLRMVAPRPDQDRHR